MPFPLPQRPLHEGNPIYKRLNFYLGLLLLVGELGTALLRVEVFVPLNRPLHRLVRNQQRQAPVQDLVAGAPKGVEDGGAEGSRQRVLAVLREAVGDDALLGEGAECAPGSHVLSWLLLAAAGAEDLRRSHVG